MQLLPGKNDNLVMLKLGNEWLVRALVLLSLATHLVLILTAGIRRRRAIGVRTTLLWFSYQVAGWAATHSISNLMLGISTSREQQLHAFWTPFLLMHLALPDNISAYSLQDNALSSRQLARAPAQVIGAIFILCKHVLFARDAGTLLPASYLMFSLGIAKYIESVWALRRGNMGSIRPRLIKKMKAKDPSDAEHLGRDFDNEQALLIAHDLLDITMGAFADYSLWRLKPGDYRRGRPFSRSKGWQDMCKVVQMELSLMYDVMFTKAAVGHTWLGYCIRIVSPPFTATALLLFWYGSKDGQRREDVIITYTLLLVTLVLEVGWLLGSLGSTWTCAFLKHTQHWLIQCSLGRWHHLIRSLGFVAGQDPTSYRLWSGTIGQYNLLSQRCSGGRDGSGSGTSMSISSKLVKIVATADSWMEYQYGYSKSKAINIACGRNLLFREIWEILKLAFPPKDLGPRPPLPPKEAEKQAEKQSAEKKESQQDSLERQTELADALHFGPEFQEVVLRWHIATDIFLLCRPRSAASSSGLEYKYVKAIEELSNYMMFLVVVRPGMLPGLYLRSMHDATLNALASDACCPDHATVDSQGKCTASPTGKEQLAEILLAMEAEPAPADSNKGYRSRLQDSSFILSDGTLYAEVMLQRVGAEAQMDVFRKSTEKAMEQLHNLVPGFKSPCRLLEMQDMLELIFNAWVRLLVHASTRCGRGAHAKQLSRGGDLTTVVWILTEHAGIFRIKPHN